MFLMNQEKINAIFSQKVRILLEISAVFILLGLVSFVLYKMFFAPKPFDTLSGNIYLTLVPLGEKVADIYRFDVKTRQFEKVFNDNFIKFTGKITPNTQSVAFVSAKIDLTSTFFLPSKDFLQVKLYNRSEKNFVSLTESNSINKRLGNWSLNGEKISFTSQEEGSDINTFLEPNKWTVNVVDLQGNSQFVDSGTNPLLSPDGTQLLFLKNDGIYIRTLSEQRSEKVYDSAFPDVTHVNMKLGISKDGESFALGIPGRNQLLLFDILSWKPFSLRLIGDIGLKGKEAFWPVFSPDGRYIVFQIADSPVNVSEILKNPFLIVYDRATKKYLTLTTLNDYDFNSAFVDDWSDIALSLQNLSDFK